MALYILRENFLNKLRGSVGANLKRYRIAASWVKGFAGISQWEVKTSVDPAAELKLSLPSPGDFKDLENAIAIHSALPDLTPLQARDPRLWTRLTHVEFWDYMRKRWEIERFDGRADAREKSERFIVQRYFIGQNQGRAMLRNGIARLWWIAHLTHDASRKDPYELTGVLLSTLDITQQILERNLGRVPQVTTGFLEFLLQYEGELLTTGNANRAQIRHLAKHLNLQGGVCLLDCMRKDAIMEMLEEEFTLIKRDPTLLTTGGVEPPQDG